MMIDSNRGESLLMEMDELKSITYAHKAKKQHIKLKKGTLGVELCIHQGAF